MAIFRFNPIRSSMLPTECLDDVYATRWDRVPIGCELSPENGGWLLKTEGDSSVYGYFPWDSSVLGKLMIQTATLAVRPEPYDLMTELARGTLNQTQNYMAECEHFGLQISAETKSELRGARQVLARVVTHPAKSDAHTKDAEQVIEQSIELNSTLAEELANAVRQNQPSRLNHLPRGTRMDRVIDDDNARNAIQSTFDVLHLPIVWANIESEEGHFDWSGTDRLFEQAEKLGKRAVAGPIISGDTACLPAWALARRDQFDKFRDGVSRFVNQVAARYASRVDQWYAVGGLNTPSGLGLNDQLRILLAAGVIERLRRSDPNTPRMVSIDRPWGEYLAHPSASLSPLGFLDALIRADIGVNSIGVELNLGEWEEGTLWRHPLTVIQRINEFSTLEKPITILLRATDAQAKAVRQMSELLRTNNSIDAVVWNQWNEGDHSRFPSSALWRNAGPSAMLEQMQS